MNVPLSVSASSLCARVGKEQNSYTTTLQYMKISSFAGEASNRIKRDVFDVKEFVEHIQ